MSESDGGVTDLSWFYHLHPRVQVSLLRDPYAPLAGDLAVRLGSNGPGVYTAQWLSNGDPARWSLAPDAARTLSAIRLQLDHWWSDLPADEQAYIVENRTGELDGKYRDLVLGASRDPVNDGPHAHLVVVVSDNRTGRFRLPEMIRIYVEMTVAA